MILFVTFTHPLKIRLHPSPFHVMSVVKAMMCDFCFIILILLWLFLPETHALGCLLSSLPEHLLLQYCSLCAHIDKKYLYSTQFCPVFFFKAFQRVVFQVNCTGTPIQVSCSRKFRNILQQISWSGSVQTLLLCPWKAGFLSGLSDGSRWFLAMFRTTAINFICLWFGFVKLSSLLYWCYHVVIFSLVVKIKRIAPDYN